MPHARSLVLKWTFNPSTRRRFGWLRSARSWCPFSIQSTAKLRTHLTSLLRNRDFAHFRAARSSTFPTAGCCPQPKSTRSNWAGGRNRRHVISLAKGVSASLGGSDRRHTALVHPAIMAEPGLVTVVDFFASNVYGKQKWLLWEKRRQQAPLRNHSHALARRSPSFLLSPR